jgi:hypothetical protein
MGRGLVGCRDCHDYWFLELLADVLGFSAFHTPSLSCCDGSAPEYGRQRQLVCCVGHRLVILRAPYRLGALRKASQSFLLGFYYSMRITAPELRWMSGYVAHKFEMLMTPSNQSPEPTAVAAAVAIHVASRRWLSFGR